MKQKKNCFKNLAGPRNTPAFKQCQQIKPQGAFQPMKRKKNCFKDLAKKTRKNQINVKMQPLHWDVRLYYNGCGGGAGAGTNGCDVLGEQWGNSGAQALFGEGPKVRHQCNPHGTNGAYTYSAICERK